MSADEHAIEKEIQAKGKTAPRLTPEYIDAQIEREEYHVFDEVMTVCVLTLKNGYKVTGESACASPENFDQEIGRKISRGNARNKIWALEGYVLRSALAAKGDVPAALPEEPYSDGPAEPVAEQPASAPEPISWKDAIS
mgnify:FL=1